MSVAPTLANWTAMLIVCFALCFYGGPLVERLGERFGRWLSRKIQ